MKLFAKHRLRKRRARRTGGGPFPVAEDRKSALPLLFPISDVSKQKIILHANAADRLSRERHLRLEENGFLPTGT